MKIKIDNFEGPLDLLLQLTESNELDITEISLLQVAEQYLSYLEKVEDKKPDELADFLLIAAKLLYIKSKVLLPGLEMDDEEGETDLAEQLRLYKKYIQASQFIQAKFEDNSFAFSRPLVTGQIKVEFEPPESLNGNKLKKVLEIIIKDLEVIIKLPKKSLEKVISIKEKIKDIQKVLAKKDLISFDDLVSQLKNKTEIIISFLGILELNKQKQLALKQDKIFGEIIISKIAKD